MSKEPIKIRLSSTVIVILKWGVDNIPNIINSNKKPLSKFDYRVMMVKRSDQLKFFPSAHTFMGGSVDPHDLDKGWEQVIKEPLSIKDLSTKVSALREVFEETNFFIDSNQQKLLKSLPSSRIEKLQKDLMDKEQSKTNNFLLDFFKESAIEKINLSNLYQWGRWITPILGPKQTHRFDTHFYVTPIYEYPDTSKVCGSENVKLDWFSPDEALEEHRCGNISLPPPTWLTFHQLSKCNTLEEVIETAKKRESLNCLYDPIMTKPIIPSNSSSLIPQERHQLLQGDHLYENNSNSNLKNRIITKSRTGDLNNQYSWIYEYQNTIPNSIDNQFDGANTVLPPKL